MFRLKKLVVVLVAALLLGALMTACKTKTFTLSFDAQNGTQNYHVITGNGNKIIQFPENPQKEGFVFGGWFYDNNSWQQPLTDQISLLEDVTVYARWKPKGTNPLGTGSADDPYIITTKEHLFWMENQVNSGQRFIGQYFLLDADISLGGMEWIPIGLFTAGVVEMKMLLETDKAATDYDYCFGGIFDGQGHVISDFKISVHYFFSGFFGFINGEIKNLGLKEFLIDIKVDLKYQNFDTAWRQSDDMYVAIAGGLVGGNYGKLQNCYTEGEVNQSVKNVGNYAFVPTGGLAGVNWAKAQIINCYTLTNVNSASDSEAVAGGVVAGNYGLVQGCYATGNIDAKGRGYGACAGGLVGRTHSPIKNSYATGNVSSTLIEEVFESMAYAGGLVSANWKDSVLENCYATGNVTSKGSEVNVGGLTGISLGTVRNCYAIGNTSATATKVAYVGGIAGRTWSTGVIENSLALGKVSAAGDNEVYTDGLAVMEVALDERGLIFNCFIYQGLTPKPNSNDVYICTKSQLANTEFYSNMLRWKSDFWNIDDLILLADKVSD